MTTFRVDRAGLGRFAKSAEVRKALHHYADPMATAAQTATAAVVDGPVEVEVDDYTTDRAAVAVTVLHPGAIGAQMKYGVLTRAASGQGLDVNER